MTTTSTTATRLANPRSIYQVKGYANRFAYLRALADANEVDIGTVLNLACILGQEEDFDGLVKALKDMDPLTLEHWGC